jgi:hypothetical protein
MADSSVVGPATAQPSGDTLIHPFTFQASADDLVDLKRRIAATKWPERETVSDATQGVNLATMQKLAHYWQAEHDWRKAEAKLNSYSQFVTNIDGLAIHFIHVRSKYPNALPVIITHGWPESVIEQLKVIDPLTNPAAFWRKRGGRVRCRDPVVAGLRLFRKADHDRLGPATHRTRLGGADEAPGLYALRRAGRRLGECRHVAAMPRRSSPPIGSSYRAALRCWAINRGI